MYNTEFIRYFYILLFFCVVFVAMYNSVTEAIAFKFLTGVQVLFGLIFFFQMLNDSGVNNKGLRIDIPKTMYTSASSMMIPYYWVLLPALVIQLISSVFVTLTTDYLQRKYNHVKLIKNDRWSLEMYKWMFIVSTLSLIFLIYSYCNDFNDGMSLNGSYKTILMIAFLLSIVFPIINLIISKKLSKLQFNTTQ
jgi:hypothetical protein